MQGASTRLTAIYVLVDPNTMEVRYVGKSTSPQVRYRRHILDAVSGRSDHKARWIASLLSQGQRPELRIIELCPPARWATRERHWIAVFRNLGTTLTNHKSGGEGGNHDHQTRAKMRAAKLGKPAHNRGKSASPATRQRQSEAARRKWDRMTPEERSEWKARRGHLRPPKPTTGYRHTAEAKARIVAAIHQRARSKRLLSPEQVREIKALIGTGITQREIARRFGVGEHVVSGIKHGTRYPHD